MPRRPSAGRRTARLVLSGFALVTGRGEGRGACQRVTSDGALVAGIALTCDAEAVADVLEPVYAALDVPFDPDSVGSIERAGGESDPETVAKTIETALADGYVGANADREA